MAHEEKWEVLESVQVLEHPFLNVEMQRVRLPDGRVIPDWPIVRTSDYVNIAVVNPHGQFMILEGYKHGLGRSSWQVPGGYIEPGEDPLGAAKRELLEETGYTSERWMRLGSYIMDGNRHVGRGSYFLALDAVQFSDPDNKDLETFDVKWETREEVERALTDGRIGIVSYAITLSLALLALRRP